MIVQRAGPDEPAMVRRGKENAVAAVAIRFSRTLRFGKIWLRRRAPAAVLLVRPASRS